MTPELIGILAVGATLTALLLALWRDARADNRALRAEVRTDSQILRTELSAEIQSLRTEVRADIQNLRADVHTDVSNLRDDVQALTERTSRVEGVIQGLFAGRSDRDRHDDAA